MEASSSTIIGDPQVFKRHIDSVLCCSIDGNHRLAVSGGIDDTAFVWDANTKHVIFECQGHKESVVAVGFSVESTYVATGDLNGYIQVRSTTTGNKLFDYEIDEVNWIMWHNSSDYVLLAGTTKGDFWMWNINDPAAVKTFPSFGHSCTIAKLMPDGFNIVAGYGDGSLRMFDLKTMQCTHQYTDPARAEIICLDINPKKALLAIGCIDSTVKLITCGNFKAIGVLKCTSPEEKGQPEAGTSHQLDEDGLDDLLDIDRVEDKSDLEALEVIDEYYKVEKGEVQNEEEEDDISLEEEYDEVPISVVSVESVLFSPCGNHLTAANNLGSIHIWDVSTQATRCECHTGVGITRCTWTHYGNLITACLDGCIRVYDQNLSKLNEIPLHSDQILDIAYREKVLVTASEDKTCRGIRLLNH